MFDEIFNKLLLVTIKEDQKISFVCFFKKRELFSFIFVKFHYLLMLFSLKKSINFKENIFKENRIKPVTYEISKTKSPIIFFRFQINVPCIHRMISKRTQTYSKAIIVTKLSC